MLTNTDSFRGAASQCNGGCLFPETQTYSGMCIKRPNSVEQNASGINPTVRPARLTYVDMHLVPHRWHELWSHFQTALDLSVTPA
jgi:hypothetical protein